MSCVREHELDTDSRLLRVLVFEYNYRPSRSAVVPWRSSIRLTRTYEEAKNAEVRWKGEELNGPGKSTKERVEIRREERRSGGAYVTSHSGTEFADAHTSTMPDPGASQSYASPSFTVLSLSNASLTNTGSLSALSWQHGDIRDHQARDCGW